MLENKMTGAAFSPKDVRDHLLKSTSVSELPPEFELKLVRVKDQGNVCSCVAHVLSEVVEYYNSVQLNDTEQMSTGFLYGNREGMSTGAGMNTRSALKNLRKYGDCKKNNFRENIEVPEAIDLYNKRKDNLAERAYLFRISSYAKVNDIETAKKSLVAGNPVVMAMTWYNDMKVVDDVLTSEFEKVDNAGGHCLLIYGYDERGWKVQNSWGKQWGNKGTCIIPYSTDIREMWVITDNIIDGTEVEEKFNTAFGQFIAKLLNKFLNLFKKD